MADSPPLLTRLAFTMPHALIVEDDPNSLSGLTALLAADGFSVDTATSLAEARTALGRAIPDVVLVDLNLPDGSGFDLLQHLPQQQPNGSLPVIVLTGNATVESAIEGLRHGIWDYLLKPINIPRLRSLLARIPRPYELIDEVQALRASLRRLGRFGALVGRSEAMQHVYDMIEHNARTETAVLFAGEAGTGKKLAARTLHDLSRRRKGPFLSFDCRMIAQANRHGASLDSVLFGHERGAFDGAERRETGLFEQAGGGTLFLDEITEMPLESQVKLLRVLETGRVTRLGSTREIDVDVRIVAATNRDPEAAMADGKLRPDLYHRINVFPIPLPSLRERGDDIPMLADAFLQRYNDESGRNLRFAPAAREALKSYAWPGNVRELRNFVQRASIFSDADVIETLPPPIMEELSNMVDSQDDRVTVPFGTPLEEVDRKLILGTIAQCGGVKAQAAEVLDVSLKTIYNRLAQLEGEVEKPDS